MRLWIRICLCVLAAGLLVSCGEAADSVDVPLEERSANDIPLDPPTLEFRVSPSGEVDASPEREAEAGEAVGVSFDNDSDEAYKLRLFDPEGDKVFALTVPARDESDGRAMPRTPGEHWVEIHPVDDPGAVERFSVEVSET